MKRLPSPNGAKCESPGQRLGYQVLKHFQALKGRHFMSHRWASNGEGSEQVGHPQKSPNWRTHEWVSAIESRMDEWVSAIESS